MGTTVNCSVDLYFCSAVRITDMPPKKAMSLKMDMYIFVLNLMFYLIEAYLYCDNLSVWLGRCAVSGCSSFGE